MIIEYTFADDILEKIEEELINYESEKTIKIKNSSISKSADIDWIIKNQFYSLPINSSGSTEVIQITKEYHYIMVNEWEKQGHNQNGIEEALKSVFPPEFPEDDILTAIQDKLSRLVYQYDLVIKTTQETNGLFGIVDEEKILLIHLNKYNEILNSDFKQIDFLYGITLNKKISDLILKIYIRFINLRLKMLNPKVIQFENGKNEQISKIIWKGSQKELLELFVELQNKEWIDEFKWGERSKKAHSICNLFDLTLTKKNKNSNVENSFYQILKGIHNKKTKERDYNEILGESKERKFNEIKKNRC